jgi:N-acetylmuramoyl-L-alanine amidase
MMNIGVRGFVFFKTILIAFLILLIFSTILFKNKTQAAPGKISNDRLILIDPGHGGIDGGAVSRSGVLEKHINLSISIKVKNKLEALGYRVILTREEDKGFYTSNKNINIMKSEDLNNRCKIKRASNCDFFISIHQNFFEQSSCNGAQVWFSKNEESKEFAKILQNNFKRDLGPSTREEKDAKNAYKILRCYTNIPSVIVECGFLTNPEEEKKLVTNEYQDKVADCIARSINEYFENYKCSCFQQSRLSCVQQEIFYGYNYF